MSSTRFISIQGTDHSLSTSNIADDTSIYIVNRLAAKTGAAYGGYKLHYRTNGIWLKCDHSSPLKKYRSFELEFRLPHNPSVFAKRPKETMLVHKSTKGKGYYKGYNYYSLVEISQEIDYNTAFKRYYRLGSTSIDGYDNKNYFWVTKDIEQPGTMDEQDQEKTEAAKVRSMYISAQRASNSKRKEVKSLRRGVTLTQRDIDALLDGDDFY
ncbi:hypothetical protein LPJ53_001753 [Coemansia erecta]|uniref:Uncharacterized protein n=1 Tax=Coemansia erecta TaxID=147472 RepID=A0A9W7XZF8_9FUNG|nr:hypothetical protein LPJ53_001753 [Coemansia erecta]